MPARKIKKILFVHSAHYDDRGRLVQSKGWWNRLTTVNVEKLGLLILAAMTPSQIEVEKVEEYFADVDFATDADVIGIHAQVMQLGRAKDLAREFRRRGKVVLMGGFLPTMHPELITDDVDAYCVGEAEGVWRQMLADIEAGTLKKAYQQSEPFPLEELPVPRYDLADRSRMTVLPVQATRGCPFVCEYCSIIEFYQKRYRLRPVADVVRDIRASRARQLSFVDDNLMENVAYSKELFRAMAPLKVGWGTQCTVNIARDEELLQLARKAGCVFVAVGFESLSQQNLNNVAKGFNRVSDFEAAIKKIQKSGIAVHALIVFGFPEDAEDTFDETVEWLERMGVSIAEFFLFTPYPKTPAGKKVFDAGLVVDPDLNHFRESYVVFKHPRMSADDIQRGYWRALRRFYSLRSILKRLWRGEYEMKYYHLLSNLYYMYKVRRGIVPVYFGAGNQVPKDVSKRAV